MQRPREKSLQRLLNIILDISQKPYTRQSLALKYKVDSQTIYRDIISLEEVGIPIYKTENYNDNAKSEKSAGRLQLYYKIDRYWLDKVRKI